ncbi:23S rRNA (pseudouridine(1915)-N(3))-methyltransferase RlmH [Candidatus Vallotia cooleyia]|uniref:23S rRNA (pseudouridine(1915)-N(3))-methyltransferase RlmH n=1 Tax=Candidatus Vallotiella adelgis TaxID=1177211 RepID=UPI001D010C6E
MARGYDYTTIQLAQLLQLWQRDRVNVTFMIGGPYKIVPDIKERAKFLLRYSSSITLPHALVRVLLIG